MAPYRVPGPFGTQDQPVSLGSHIDDGTNAVTATPTPAYVHAEEGNNAPGPQSDLARVLALFHASPTPTADFTQEQYERAAERLDVDVAAIAAVAQVQSRKAPPDSFRWPAELFETSKLEYVPAKEDTRAHISVHFERLSAASQIDARTALKAASWGKFHLPGAQFARAGYQDVESFVLAMVTSSAAQLNAFVAYVRSDRILNDVLREHDWATFARRYLIDGASDQPRLEDEYDRLSQEAAPRKSLF